ncbi:hypothetical protein [Lewinella sp. W8]|uniref:hypothetical protein n=1 Tax=Lewinella sp. W8 TaxID=2528208 RepID=UPI0010680EF6|nr:hypothetical protein [Lewinella sp. W8]MTB50200.1 hypothetical protein [Lewinella sp. W8]
MKTIIKTPLLLFLAFQFFLACEKEDMRERPNVTSIAIKEIEVEMLSEINLSNREPWDNDNSGADLYLRFSSDVSPFKNLSDTIQDFKVGFDELRLLEEIVIGRSVNSFTIHIYDYDPEDPFRVDDRVQTYPIAPWTEDRLNFVENDELEINFGVNCWLRVKVERRF